MRILIASAFAAGAGLTPVAAQEDAAEASPLVFERPYQFGTATYRMIQNGEEAGGMVYGLEPRGDELVLTDHSWLDPGIDETVRVTIDPHTLKPKSLDLVFVGGASSLIGDLAWSGDDVSGYYLINSGDGSGGRVVDYHNRTAPDLLYRGSLFGLATAIPLEEGAVYERPWFASFEGAEQTLRVEVGGLETVETALGTFEARRVDFKNVTPENVLYITEGEDPRVVRIDVVGQPLFLELVDFESSE